MSNALLSHLGLFLLGLLVPALAHTGTGPSQRCTQLARTHVKNAAVTTRYLRAGESYKVPASCGMGLGEDLLASTDVNVCVVNVVYNTSRSSATRIEAWLPDVQDWSGRLLGSGGFGLGGCVDYDTIKYGSSLGFSAFGHDGGHDGESGAAFATSDEVIADYAHRALHVATVASKQLTLAYYGRPQQKSVQDYPADFDGVLAGAPVVNLVNAGSAGLRWDIASHKLAEADLALVAAEVLRQCDGLDGVRDGIVSDPAGCEFVPEVLLCGGKKRGDCLSSEQVQAVRTFYSPIYGQDGQLLAPRMDPGAEGDTDLWPLIFGNPYFYPLAMDWFQYVVYNDSTWEPSPSFGLKEITDAVKRDQQVPVSSFNPDISAFRKRGGKLLSYHGSRDLLIPSATSLWYYQSVARTLALPPSKLDEFYRLFVIPGMNHCGQGPGAWMFGQMSWANWSNSSDSNALFALVDWVEKGQAPETLRGSTDGTFNSTTPSTRLHCKYPARSVWKADAEDWVCVSAP